MLQMQRFLGVGVLAFGLLLKSASAESPYGSYMAGLIGGCPTFGPSTQDALSMIARTQQLLDQLSRDPNCQGIRPALDSMHVLRAQVARLTREDISSKDLIEAQNEAENLALLANSLSSSSADVGMLPWVTQSLAQSRTRLAVLTARSVNQDYSSSVRMYGTLPDVAQALNDIGSQLPELERCTSKKPNMFVDIVGSLLPTVAAAGNPAFGVAATTAGKLMKTLAHYLSQRKYSSSIRDLDDLQKYAAINCAIETVQFSSCTAKEAHELLEWAALDGGNATTPRGAPRWMGYNALVTEMPALTSWINRLRTGRRPEREEDSQYVADTIEMESHFLKAKAAARAYISEALDDVKGQADQRVRGIEALKKVYSKLIPRGDSFFGGSGGPKINVYTRVMAPQEIPFFLVGKKPADFGYTPGPQSDPLNSIEGKLEILDARLVEILSDNFELLLSGDGNFTGAEDRLAKLLSLRRVADAENLMLDACKPQADIVSPCQVLHHLRDWLHFFISNPQQVRKAYEGYENIDGRVAEAIAHAQNTLDIVKSIIVEIDKPYSGSVTPETKVNAISELLGISKSGDRFIVERVTDLVQIQLVGELADSRQNGEIRAILNSSKLELVDKLTQYGGRPRQDQIDEMYQTVDLHRSHLQSIWSFFGKDVRKQLEKSTDAGVSNLICARVLAMPTLDKDLVKLCTGRELRSVYLKLKDLPEAWKPKLQLRFNDYVGRSLEERSCAYRNYRRNTYLYEVLRKPRAR